MDAWLELLQKGDHDELGIRHNLWALCTELELCNKAIWTVKEELGNTASSRLANI